MLYHGLFRFAILHVNILVLSPELSPFGICQNMPLRLLVLRLHCIAQNDLDIFYKALIKDVKRRSKQFFVISLSLSYEAIFVVPIIVYEIESRLLRQFL